MFKKILVVEDLDAISHSISLALERFEIPEINHSKYCDDAHLKIKRAILDQQPYDLVITDLSFVPDHRKEKLVSGKDLIIAVKKVQPDIKVIVYSIEDKSFLINSLFQDCGINAYVLKSRHSITELQKSIKLVYETNQKVTSKDLENILRNQKIFEIESFDIELLKFLSKGYNMEEISFNFRAIGLSPNGLSSIEKRISKLKIYFKASNNAHLISISKDFGLI